MEETNSNWIIFRLYVRDYLLIKIKSK